MYRVLRDASFSRIWNPAQRQARRDHLRRRDAREERLRLLPQGKERHAEAAGHPDDRLLLRQGSHPEAIAIARPRRRAVQEAGKSRQAARDAPAVAPESSHRKSRSQSRRNSRQIRRGSRIDPQDDSPILIRFSKNLFPLPAGEEITPTIPVPLPTTMGRG